MTMSSRINLDCFSDDFKSVALMLETTKILYRLYGRNIAHKYFTNHFCFDIMKLTVK